jgi:hypothetical protein
MIPPSVGFWLRASGTVYIYIYIHIYIFELYVKYRTSSRTQKETILKIGRTVRIAKQSSFELYYRRNFRIYALGRVCLLQNKVLFFSSGIQSNNNGTGTGRYEKWCTVQNSFKTSASTPVLSNFCELIIVPLLIMRVD